MNFKNILSESPNVNAFLNALQANMRVSAFGANAGEKSLVIHKVAKKSIVVCSDFVSMSEMKETLISLEHKVGVITLGLNSPIFTRAQDVSSMLEFITNMLDFYYGKTDTLIVLCEALLQRLPDIDFFNKSIEFETNKKISFSELAIKLVKLGYVRQDIVSAKGQFSIRGDIVDIFPINNQSAIRLDFFGDVIESISEFDAEDMVKTKVLNNFIVYPATIFLLTEDEIINAKNNILNDFEKFKLNGDYQIKLAGIVYEVINKLENNNLSLNNGFILPYLNFNNNLLSLFNSDLIILDEPKKIFADIAVIYKNNQESIFNLINNGELLSKHTQFFYSNYDIINNNIIAEFCNLGQTLNNSKNITFRTVGIRKYLFDYNALATDIMQYKKSSYNVFLCAGNKQSVQSISNFLNEKQITHSAHFNPNEKIAQVVLSECTLAHSASFLDAGIIIIGCNDLIKKTKHSTNLKQKKKNVFYLPKIGDFVVHEVHGVGKCVGIEKLNLNGSFKDYFILQYKSGDKLYVPSEQANTISAFLGGDKEPKLNKIGGAEFARAKAQVQESVKKLAVNLIEIYSEREKCKGFKFTPGNYLMDEFENAFIYDETNDQLEAIADVKQDMFSGKIMDRLICGDVGYGKTEVALRAAYQAVLDGKQVAFLCPTTILSQQHYSTTKQRTSEFMVNIQVLNRFKTKQQQQQILKELESGQIDIIIGTHRLLSGDVHFKDLGILILDEEQRFGVADKEKIKELKKNIDVLTLSATPIPRTLNMAMTGIRDISIIETPPKNRLPIQTYVTEESDALLGDAIKREFARGGQTLVVYNRVETIYNMCARLKEVAPYARIGVAHGQMSEKLLEDAILKLYNGEFDVLLATTLIESGIDLPLANTLIVIDSDRLGLAQLYQLRGRIGRSDRLAYAYFTYKANKALSQDAYKRLDAIMEFSELGSGFKIAMRDLEIRGAGNVLGKEQHGHMEKVGYELYCRLLEEAVRELKGNKKQNINPVKVDIVCPAFIPEDYILAQEQRIKAYSAISSIGSETELETIKTEYVQAFGNMPEPMLNLLKIALIKNLCEALNVKRILVNSTETKLFLYKTTEITTEKTLQTIAENQNVAVLKFEDVPIIILNINNKKLTDKLNFLIKFLHKCVID